MSGLCGIVHFDGRPVSPDILAGMTQAGIHRGPDGNRSWSNGSVALTHLALHATPEAGSDLQPLQSRDGNLVVVADARIDNRSDLSRRLLSLLRRDHPTDTELILAAYERWGTECPDHLRGDFAIVVWDARLRRLFCATDPFGTKPLHYARSGQTLCIASEAQQILQHPGISAELDELSIARRLVGANPYDHRTMYRNVRRLEQGHRLSANSFGMHMETYRGSDSPPSIRYARDEEYAEHFRHLFERAVRTRTRSSGEMIGVQMSGGLDSTSAAAMVHHLQSRSNVKRGLTAYTNVFEEVPACDEREYSNTLREELGIEVVPLFPERFPMIGHPGTPRPDPEYPAVGWEDIYSQLLDHLSTHKGRVLLTGHGGDAIVYGSPLLYADQMRKGQFGRLIRGLRGHSREKSVSMFQLAYLYLAAPMLPNSVDRTMRRLTGRAQPWRVPNWIRSDFAKRVDMEEQLRLLTRPNVGARSARECIRRNIVDPGSVGWAVYWYDRLASRFGIEVRHPFLDRDLADFVMATPPSRHYTAGRGKLLLRKAMEGVLPDRVRNRTTKTYIGPYLSHRLRGRDQERVREILSKPLLEEMGAIDGTGLRSALELYFSGRTSSFDDVIMSIVTLELWVREHLKVRTTSPVVPATAVAGLDLVGDV